MSEIFVLFLLIEEGGVTLPEHVDYFSPNSISRSLFVTSKTHKIFISRVPGPGLNLLLFLIVKWGSAEVSSHTRCHLLYSLHSGWACDITFLPNVQCWDNYQIIFLSRWRASLRKYNLYLLEWVWRETKFPPDFAHCLNLSMKIDMYKKLLKFWSVWMVKHNGHFDHGKTLQTESLETISIVPHLWLYDLWHTIEYPAFQVI